MKARIRVNLVGCLFVAVGGFLLFTYKDVAGAVLASGGLVAVAIVCAFPGSRPPSGLNE